MQLVLVATVATGQLTTTKRDSAQVKIVENRLVGDLSVAFVLSPKPLVEIEVLTPSNLAAVLGVSSALRLMNGRIAVATTGSDGPSVRLYDSTGNFQKTLASEDFGGNPFRGLFSAKLQRLQGDSIASLTQNRIRLFDSAGTLVATEDYARPASSLIAVLDGNAVLMSSAGNPTPVRRVARGSGNAVADTGIVLGRFTVSGPTTTVSLQGPGAPPMVRVPTPFSPRFSIFPYRDGLIGGDGRTPQFGIWDGVRRLTTIVRFPADQSIRPRDIEAYRVELLAQNREAARPALRAWFDGLLLPRVKPALSKVMADAIGQIWTLEYTTPTTWAARWNVFAPDGTLLGFVDTPNGFTVMDIGSDYVLGTFLDPGGKHRVCLYSLTPRRRPGELKDS